MFFQEEEEEEVDAKGGGEGEEGEWGGEVEEQKECPVLLIAIPHSDRPF